MNIYTSTTRIGIEEVYYRCRDETPYIFKAGHDEIHEIQLVQQHCQRLTMQPKFGKREA